MSTKEIDGRDDWNDVNDSKHAPAKEIQWEEQGEEEIVPNIILVPSSSTNGCVKSEKENEEDNCGNDCIEGKFTTRTSFEWSDSNVEDNHTNTTNKHVLPERQSSDMVPHKQHVKFSEQGIGDAMSEWTDSISEMKKKPKIVHDPDNNLATNAWRHQQQTRDVKKIRKIGEFPSAAAASQSGSLIISNGNSNGGGNRYVTERFDCNSAEMKRIIREATSAVEELNARLEEIQNTIQRLIFDAGQNMALLKITTKEVCAAATKQMTSTQAAFRMSADSMSVSLRSISSDINVILSQFSAVSSSQQNSRFQIQQQQQQQLLHHRIDREDTKNGKKGLCAKICRFLFVIVLLHGLGVAFIYFFLKK